MALKHVQLMMEELWTDGRLQVASLRQECALLEWDHIALLQLEGFILDQWGAVQVLLWELGMGGLVGVEWR